MLFGHVWIREMISVIDTQHTDGVVCVCVTYVIQMPEI